MGLSTNMKKTIRHELDFEKTYPYFIDHIESESYLSKMILNEIDFKQGVFFTILPGNANIEKVYKFREGEINPSESTGEIHYNQITKLPFILQRIVTMDNELSKFIAKFLKENNPCVIVEDVMRKPTEKKLEIKGVDLLFNGNEVYYILNSNTSKQSIYKVIRKANPIWHFLAVLIQGSIIPINLTIEKIHKVLDDVDYIITGAYDGEAHIFWEKRR